MSEPCKQEPQMRVMSEQYKSLDTKMDRALTALETLAEQRVEIIHLTEGLEDTRKWVKDHEKRIQTLEKMPGSAASKFLWVVFGAGVTIVPAIITGLLLWWITGKP